MRDVCILIEGILLFFGIGVILANVFESIGVGEYAKDAVWASSFFAILYIFRNQRLETL